MNTTKPEQKKSPATGGKRKPHPAQWRPRFPDSYVHARGLGSSWRSSERNA